MRLSLTMIVVIVCGLYFSGIGAKISQGLNQLPGQCTATVSSLSSSIAAPLCNAGIGTITRTVDHASSAVGRVIGSAVQGVSGFGNKLTQVGGGNTVSQNATQ